MFEKLKSIYKKIINMIIPRKIMQQLETSNLEKEEQLINKKETHKNLKMQIYPFNEKEAQNILGEIQKEDPETEYSNFVYRFGTTVQNYKRKDG